MPPNGGLTYDGAKAIFDFLIANYPAMTITIHGIVQQEEIGEYWVSFFPEVTPELVAAVAEVAAENEATLHFAIQGERYFVTLGKPTNL